MPKWWVRTYLASNAYFRKGTWTRRSEEHPLCLSVTDIRWRMLMMAEMTPSPCHLDLQRYFISITSHTPNEGLHAVRILLLSKIQEILKKLLIVNCKSQGQYNLQIYKQTPHLMTALDLRSGARIRESCCVGTGSSCINIMKIHSIIVKIFWFKMEWWH